MDESIRRWIEAESAFFASCQVKTKGGNESITSFVFMAGT